MTSKKELQEKLDYSHDRLNTAWECRDHALTALEAEGKSHTANIDAVIDGLGIRESYPDISETKMVDAVRYVPRSDFNSYAEYYQREEVVTDYGRDRFILDIKAAAEAKKGSDAAKRIASALKKVTK